MIGEGLSENLAQECIESAKKFGIQAKIFPATWGKDIDKHFVEQDLKIYKKGQKKKDINPGLKGCLLSHYRLWKKCIESQEPMMIFEHDNIVLRDIPEKLLNTFEDVLHLDFASRQVTDYEDFTETYNGDDVKQWCPQIPRLSGHELYNKTHIKGSHAYIIKPLGATKMVDWVWNVGALSPDLAMNSTAIDLRYTLTSFCRINPRYWMESKKRSKNSFCRPKRWRVDG
tara:strand:- start:2022 stop:2705 length:684 start_codon:yes stop_codon:yes gene_type:complete